MTSCLSARVLLVDEDAAFRQLAEQMLATLGHMCVVAPDVELGWKLFESEHFDVVVSDPSMSGNVGLEFVERLVASEKEPLVILATGSPSIEAAIAAVNLRAVAYLVKPFDIGDLSKGIERALSLGVGRATFERVRNRLKELQADLGEISGQIRSELLESRAQEPPGRVNGWGPREDISSTLLEAGLTRREQEIVHHFVDGHRLSTIANRLCISPHTIRRHLKGVFMKLEVKSQTELVEKLKPWP